VPDNINYACYECAFALLDGVDPELEQENLGVSNAAFSSMKTTYSRDIGVPEHFREGIPSAYAWRFLRYYLTKPGSVTIYRV